MGVFERNRGLPTSSETAMKSLSVFKSSMSCVPMCFAEATPTGSGGPGGGGGAGDGSGMERTSRVEHCQAGCDGYMIANAQRPNKE